MFLEKELLDGFIWEVARRQVWLEYNESAGEWKEMKLELSEGSIIWNFLGSFKDVFGFESYNC